MKVDIVTGDDWSGVYVDGRLKEEGHSVDPYRLLLTLGVEFQTHTVDEDWLTEEGLLPEEFDAVVLDI